MWQATSEAVAGQAVIRFRIFQESDPVSYAEVIRLWQQDADFCSWFVSLLADAPFDAFRWETPAVTTKTVNRPFEFVLVDSPGLAPHPDTATFAVKFRVDPGTGIVVFANLRKDATLVVPCPQVEPQAYRHLAAFVRQASSQQVNALWNSVGAAMQRRLNSQPVWLSTAGAGVSWLHVRLDDRPKYYHYQPYRTST